MSFPACRHARKRPSAGGLRWLADEPFRVFFVSGALWSVVGVLLWPLFYQGKLGYYPATVHARVMIEAFAGAFVVGFLGTAGPRMAGAPKLTVAELLWLLALHEAGAVCHLRLHVQAGDRLFAALLVSLLAALAVRVVRYREGPPPPQLLLAMAGVACGIAGAAMMGEPETMADPFRLRFAGLLLYQGLLLPPVLGIGAFLFPRILGGDFGGPASPEGIRRAFVRATAAAALLVAGFWIEAGGRPVAGNLLRAGVCLAYLLIEVRWRKAPSSPPRGSVAGGLPWALLTGLAGMAMAGFVVYPLRISIEHLLYIGGFGLLILLVASRVLFGHSGEIATFARRSWFVRFLVFLGVLTAATRGVPGFLPQLAVSHHQYAALTWSVLAILWLFWHARRFATRDDE